MSMRRDSEKARGMLGNSNDSASMRMLSGSRKFSNDARTFSPPEKRTSGGLRQSAASMSPNKSFGRLKIKVKDKYFD